MSTLEKVTSEKIQAEIAKIFADMEKTRSETNRIDKENQSQKLDAEIARVFAGIELTRNQTNKVIKENQWYVAIVASTATLAIVAVVKLFL
jgi:hypothetical protein